MAGTTLGTAYIQIVPSADGIAGSIRGIMAGEGEAAGASVGSKIGMFAKKAIVAAGIGAAVKASLDEGGKLQQSYLGGLETIYNGAEDQIRSYARAAATAGISMNDYAEQAISFGAALKQSFGSDIAGAAKAADQAIMDMADNSAKMGTDIESVQNAYQGFAKQNYTMLDNLKLGYGGTKGEMERLLADAEKFSGVKYNIDDLGDVYSAIHVIQQEMGIAGVAANEASSTLSGSFGAMKASWSNLLGSMAIGENVEQSLSNLVTTFNNWAFGNLIPMIGTIIKSLPTVISTFIRQGIPLLMSSINNMVKSIADNVKKFADGVSGTKIKQWVTTMLPKILQSATSLLSTFASGILRNIGKIMLAVGKIGIAIVKGLGSALWGKVTAAANGIKERFTAPISALAVKVKVIAQSIKTRFVNAISSLVGKAHSTASSIKSKFLSPITALRDKLKGILNKIKGMFPLKIGKIFSGLKLPKIKVSKGEAPFGIGGKGKLPSFSVEWNAKGGVYDAASIIGIGVGESGREIVTPESLMRQIVSESNAGMEDTLSRILVLLEYIATTDKSIKVEKREFGRLVNEVVYG